MRSGCFRLRARHLVPKTCSSTRCLEAGGRWLIWTLWRALKALSGTHSSGSLQKLCSDIFTKIYKVQGGKLVCCDLHALRKPGNKVMDVAGLLEPSGVDLRAEDYSLPRSIKSDPLLFRLPFPLQRGFQSCKPVLDAGHDADMEEVLGVVGGGVAAKAELPSCLPLHCRCL